jgi:signal transduction histidine kinase
VRQLQALLNLARASLAWRRLRRTDCEQLLEGLRPDFAGVELTSGSLPVVRADPDQLRQVLRTLIANAVRHRGAEPPRIHVSARPVGRQWLFEVRDNGVGIDPAQHHAIFHAFSGAIQLPACRRLVRRHGGWMWVESARGQGATFRFSLPATREVGDA